MNKVLKDKFKDEIKLSIIDDKIKLIKSKNQNISFQYYFSKKGGIQIMLSIINNKKIERHKILFLPFKEFELNRLIYNMYILSEYHFGKMKLLKKDENGLINEIDFSKTQLKTILKKIYIDKGYEMNLYDRNYIRLSLINEYKDFE